MTVCPQSVKHDFKRCPPNQVVCGLQTLIDEDDIFSPEFDTNPKKNDGEGKGKDENPKNLVGISSDLLKQL